MHCQSFKSLADGFAKLTHEFELHKREAAFVQRELNSKIESVQRESAFEMHQMQRNSELETKQMQLKSDSEMKQMQLKSDSDLEKMQREMQSQSVVSASKHHSLEQQIVLQSSKMETMERELKISLTRDMKSQFLETERHYFRNLSSNADKHLQFARAGSSGITFCKSRPNV